MTGIGWRFDRRARVAVVALLLAGCDKPAQSDATISPAPSTHNATVFLQFKDGGTCSGTVVGPSVILTAEHCIKGTALVRINGQNAKQISVLSDKADHSLIRVSIVFGEWATLGAGMVQGESLHFWGNPRAILDMYRRGYVVGAHDGLLWLDAGVARGDSGAGIFNERGLLVGVVSKGAQFGGISMAGAYPLQFTAAQWAEAKA